MKKRMKLYFNILVGITLFIIGGCSGMPESTSGKQKYNDSKYSAKASNCPKYQRGKIISSFSLSDNEEAEIAENLQNIIEIVNASYLPTDFNDELAKAWGESLASNIDTSKMVFLENDLNNIISRFNDCIFFQQPSLPIAMELFYQANISIDSLIKSIPVWVSETKPMSSIDKKPLFQDWPKTIATIENRWKEKISFDLKTLSKTESTMDALKGRLENQYINMLVSKKQFFQERYLQVLFDSLLENIDPRSSFFSLNALNDFDMKLSPSLSDVGIMLEEISGYIIVDELKKNGSAEKSKNIFPDDVILSVENQGSNYVEVSGLPLNQVIKLLEGKAGTNVTLRVLRKGTIKELTLVRKTIRQVNSVVTGYVENVSIKEDILKIGIIDYPSFYVDFDAYRKRDPNYTSSTRDFLKIINNFKSNNIDGLIIDLRDNGGGSLQEGVTATDIILKKGTILQVKDAKNKPVRNIRSKNDSMYGGPLVVLISRKSAGSSEILAGAVQDYNRGVIVGENSFGMGIIHALKLLRSGQIKYANSGMFRVTGNSFFPNGVDPDIRLSLSLSDRPSKLMPHAKFLKRVDPITYPKLKKSFSLSDLKIQHDLRTRQDYVAPTEQSQNDHALGESIFILSDMIVFGRNHKYTNAH